MDHIEVSDRDIDRYTRFDEGQPDRTPVDPAHRSIVRAVLEGLLRDGRLQTEADGQVVVAARKEQQAWDDFVRDWDERSRGWRKQRDPHTTPARSATPYLLRQLMADVHFDALAYQALRDRLGATMTDPEAWDGDDTEPAILLRYVNYLAATTAPVLGVVEAALELVNFGDQNAGAMAALVAAVEKLERTRTH